MSKAVISNRIYLNCPKNSLLDKQLIEELTYKIDQQPISPYPLIISNISRVNDRIVSIPSGRLDLIPENYEVIDKRVTAEVDIPKPKFSLRPNQKEAVDAINTNGIINAKVGWGKTIAGCGLIYKFKKKTLIITTTTTIRDMWVEEITAHFGIKPGIIGGGKFETDRDICVGNIQTVRNRVNELVNIFGVVICDEVHRATAKTFTDTLNSLKPTHKIGLSGTLKRKDGLHVVLPDYFGMEVFVAKEENTMDPEVHFWDTGIMLSSNAFIPWANKITELVNNEVYKYQVLKLAKSYSELGHKVLVLSDRTSLLEWLHQKTEDCSLLITGKISDSKTRAAILSEMEDMNSLARILYGIQSIFSEGVSVNSLSCVILAAPIHNDPLLEQICGRIKRLKEGKLTPIVVDLGLKGNTGNRHRNSRSKFYIGEGWRIVNMGSI